MNKVIVTIIAIITITGAIFTATAILENESKKTPNDNVITEISEEEILDDCTDEYELMENSLKANSEKEKTSPNCAVITKTLYKSCGHTISEYSNLPQEYVNLSREEIEEKYSNFKVESFRNNEIVLYQEKDGECGEHFLVKDQDGIVTVYKILENGTQEEYEKTSVSTEYLPDTDKNNMKNGIRVDGKRNLNQLIEDFE